MAASWAPGVLRAWRARLRPTPRPAIPKRMTGWSEVSEVMGDPPWGCSTRWRRRARRGGAGWDNRRVAELGSAIRRWIFAAAPIEEGAHEREEDEDQATGHEHDENDRVIAREAGDVDHGVSLCCG